MKALGTKGVSTLLVLAGCLALAGASHADVQGCNTDYNGDGVTDNADAAVFQASLGSIAGDDNYVAAADLDEDGQVTTTDYGIFLRCSQ